MFPFRNFLPEPVGCPLVVLVVNSVVAGHPEVQPVPSPEKRQRQQFKRVGNQPGRCKLFRCIGHILQHTGRGWI